MICKNCGKELPDNVSFCTNCGTRVDLGEPSGAQEDEHTLMMWDEEGNQAAPASQNEDILTGKPETETLAEPSPEPQDENRTMVMWDDEPSSTSASQPSPEFRDENRTMVMWDDEPANTDNAGSFQTASAGGEATCPNCGAANSAGTAFCVSCGAMLSQPQPDGQANASIPPQPSVKTPKKKASKKLIIGVVAVAAVAAVAVLVIVIKPKLPAFGGNGGGERQSVLSYMKDDEAYIYKSGDKQGELITDDGFFAASISADGRYVYYIEPDRKDDTGTLMYKKLGSKEEAKELDDDVNLSGTTYVLPNGSVLYIKNGKLYLHNLKEAQKVASGVSGFEISKDDKYVYWVDDDCLTVQDTAFKNDKIEIDDVYNVKYTSDDLSDILYTDEDGDLYHCRNLKDSEKVASDVTMTKRRGDKIYYYVEEKTKEYSYYELADDDVEDSYDYAYSYCQYDLSSLSLQMTEYTIYEYLLKKGESKQLVEIEGISSFGDDIIEDYFLFDEEGEPVIVYGATELDDVFKMSDAVENYYDADMACYVKNQLEAATEWSVFYKGKTSVIAEAGDVEGIFDSAVINEANNEIYLKTKDYADYYEDSGYYKLYVCPYTADDKTCRWIIDDLAEWKVLDRGVYYICREMGDEEGELYFNGDKVDKKVYSLETRQNPSKGCFYYKDYDEDDYEYDIFYYDGKDIIEVAQDAADLGVICMDDGSVLYSTDYDDGERTICRYKNGKTAVISEDVYDMEIMEDGSIAYIKDWSEKREEGDLYIFDGKKSAGLDTGVTSIRVIYY